MTGSKVEDLPPDWWGFKHGFVSGGLLGAKPAKKKSTRTADTHNRNERAMFFEEDQENLYKLVQVCVLFWNFFSLNTILWAMFSLNFCNPLSSEIINMEYLVQSLNLCQLHISWKFLNGAG